MRITSITPMKNEGPYVLEWVAYHRSIGFNDMLVFTNDCTDGTDLILERLDEMGLVRHMTNPSVMKHNARHHIFLVKYVNKLKRLRRSDWVTHLDADEFVRVKVGKGHLTDLFNALPNIDALSLSLHSFGCNGIDEIQGPNSLVTEDFTSRKRSKVFMEVKYFANTSFPWINFFNNSPTLSAEDVERVRWVNGDGIQLPRDLISSPFKRLSVEHNGTDYVDVAHYAVRSMQGFISQLNRGNANPIVGVTPVGPSLEKASKYWTKFNKNHVKDTLLLERAATTRQAFEELLEDKELRELHEASIKHHRNLVKEMTPNPKEGYGEILSHIRQEHLESCGTPAE